MRPTLAMIANFRDIGGLQTAAGSPVRSGLLYRSAGLHRANDADLDTLARLGIRTMFDLRTGAERERHPDRVPSGATVVGLDVMADSSLGDPTELSVLMMDPRKASREFADGGGESFYVSAYREIAGLPSARAGLARMYRTLAQEGRRPALVHCTAGKDRTGWAVAALLLFLGVSSAAVMDEYMRSDAESREAYRDITDQFVARGGDREVFESLVGVQPSFLDASLDEMRSSHGTIEAYFADGLGLGDEAQLGLRMAFLDGPT